VRKRVSGRKNKTRDIEPYRKARKPVPPPTRVKPDERRKIKKKIVEEEIKESE
jgi:hypothetical protein